MKDYSMKAVWEKFAVVLAGFLFVSSQDALSAEAKSESIIEKLYNCSKIEDNTQRLACFDSSVSKLQEGEKSQEIVILDKTEIKAAKKAAFGFSMPKIKIFEEDKSDKKAGVLEIEITRITNKASRPIIITSEGQEWQVLDEAEIIVFSDPPYKGKIRAASFGSFLLEISGRNQSYRVQRIK